MASPDCPRFSTSGARAHSDAESYDVRLLFRRSASASMQRNVRLPLPEMRCAWLHACGLHSSSQLCCDLPGRLQLSGCMVGVLSHSPFCVADSDFYSPADTLLSANPASSYTHVLRACRRTGVLQGERTRLGTLASDQCHHNGAALLGNAGSHAIRLLMARPGL